LLYATITAISTAGPSFRQQGFSLKNAVSFVAPAGLCALACVLQLSASATQESPRWTTESVLK